jgi:hypothetical protein
MPPLHTPPLDASYTRASTVRSVLFSVGSASAIATRRINLYPIGFGTAVAAYCARIILCFSIELGFRSFCFCLFATPFEGRHRQDLQMLLAMAPLQASIGGVNSMH